MTIALNGSDLTVTQVVAAARHGEPVMLAPEALSSMAESRIVVEEVLRGGEPVYGLTTGVGERKAFLLDPAERQRFNHRLVLHHRIAQGEAARPTRSAARWYQVAENEGLALVSSNAFTTAWACIAA